MRSVRGQQLQFGLIFEHKEVAKQEVDDRTGSHRDQVRDDVVQVELTNKHSHDQKIACQRHQPIAGVELAQPGE